MLPAAAWREERFVPHRCFEQRHDAFSVVIVSAWCTNFVIIDGISADHTNMPSVPATRGHRSLTLSREACRDIRTVSVVMTVYLMAIVDGSLCVRKDYIIVVDYAESDGKSTILFKQ